MARDDVELPSGVTLRNTFRCGTAPLRRIAWSPEGSRLLGFAPKDVVVIWDGTDGRVVGGPIRSNYGPWNDFSWSPDGKSITYVAGSVTLFWDVKTFRSENIFSRDFRFLSALAWSPDGKLLATATSQGDLRLWDAERKAYAVQSIDSGWNDDHSVQALAFAPGHDHLAVLAGDLYRWAPGALSPSRRDTGPFTTMAFAPDGSVLVTAGPDGVLRVREPASMAETVVLEGHTSSVDSLSFSADGAFLASKSIDGMVRIWRCGGWRTVVEFADDPDTNRTAVSVAFHPRDLDVLAVSGGGFPQVRIYELDRTVLGGTAAPAQVLYTTAKIVLVGDTGVGKTGLGWRLAHDEFREHSSTHGQQFWLLDQLRHQRGDGTECEAVLWDLAGQHVYRSIHAIFLDDVDAALLLFDASNRQDPLKGVQFWLEQLGGRDKLPPTVLIASRSDRGGPVVAREEIEQFTKAYGVRNFLSVSALTATGVPELVRTLSSLVPWDRKVTTVTTVTFKRIKEFVLELRERADPGAVLVRPAELRERLSAGDPDWRFSDAEMMGAVRHLETHGYVVVLRGSSGSETVLLAPDLLVDVASSIVLEADKHPRELGAVVESDLLRGEYRLPEGDTIDAADLRILIEAAVFRLVEHNICFRAVLGGESLLIFPALIKQRRPLFEAAEAADDISYVVRGRVENVYAALVVQLGYTPSFSRVRQWQNQAQYEMESGQVCGFRLVEDREGEIELVLYYSETMPAYGKSLFQGLFEQFLYQRDVAVTPYPPVDCPQGHRQERATVVRRAREGKAFLFCDECGSRVDLPSADPPRGARSGFMRRQSTLARLRGRYETFLVRIKSHRRDRAAPRCHLSITPDQAAWAAGLVQDLREAGVLVLDDATELTEADHALAISSGPIGPAASFRNNGVCDVLMLARGGGPADYDFRDDTRYPLALFDLVLTLYAIPWDHPAFEPLRTALRADWHNSPSLRSAARVFVSYAHKDEKFKDELGVRLTALQRRGVLEVWQDRMIRPGDRWQTEIEVAMSECDLAILLVSPDFLASEFIQDEEVPFLVQQRVSQGLTLVPVIIRPCGWQQEPLLASLQALPRDGRPVITFPEENGARDQAWADVVDEIQARLIG